MSALRYYVQTMGCQMNVHDSDRMGDALRAHGWTETSGPEDADLVVFNTCSVREKAEQKLRSELGKLAPLKKAKPELVVAVAGCVAQQEGEKLLGRNPHLDLVIGPDNIPELPRLALDQRNGALPTARTVFDYDAPQFLAAQPSAIEPTRAPVSAFVTTMKGCDERCSFCIVPYTRGSERYRPSADILAEVQAWVSAGVREITLLGQTVDSFRDDALPPPASDDPDETQFPELLRAIAREVPALARLRYTSPHPRHLTTSLISAHRDLPVLAAHVHMPVQSGSNRILKRMIRRYTREEYLDRISRLRGAVPGLTLSSDFIVGFPGETDADFEETLALVAEAGFTSLFAFKYSPRPFTPALKLGDDVTEEKKNERLQRLLAQVEAQQSAHLSTVVGTEVSVLVEGLSKTAADGTLTSYQGRTSRNEIVHIPDCGRALIGEVVRVQVTEAFRHSLRGDIHPAEISRLAPKSSERRTKRSLALVPAPTAG